MIKGSNAEKKALAWVEQNSKEAVANRLNHLEKEAKYLRRKNRKLQDQVANLIRANAGVSDEQKATDQFMNSETGQKRCDPSTLKVPLNRQEFLRNRIRKTFQDGIEAGRKIQLEAGNGGPDNTETN